MKKQYKNEAEFKKDFVELLRSNNFTVFCIETEETVPGFPDVLAIDPDGKTFLFEMKITDRYGRFKMQKTQPRFYMLHQNLKVKVVVWDNGMGNYLSIPAKMVAKSCSERASLKLDIKEFLYAASFAEGEVRTGRKE